MRDMFAKSNTKNRRERTKMLQAMLKLKQQQTHSKLDLY